MKVEQHRPDRVTGLCCTLLGYSRQAYYQQQKQEEKEAFEGELVVQGVLCPLQELMVFMIISKFFTYLQMPDSSYPVPALTKPGFLQLLSTG